MSLVSKVTIGQPIAYLTDPHLWVDSRATLSIRFSMFEALVKYDCDGKIVPGLAQSWSLAEDACTWTFHLRPGVHFHDMTVLTAADAAASIRRAAGPEMPGEYGTAALLSSYLGQAEIQALDELTLQIKMPSPMADLPDLLIYAVIVPARVLDQIQPTVPGTGPYRLEKQGDNEVVLRRFEAYWGGAAPVETLHFLGIHDEKDRVKAFLDGQVDVITYMPLRHRQMFAGCARAQVIERSNPLCVIVMFNAFRGPCTDQRLRQALNYATDVDAIIRQIYAGKAAHSNGPLSKHHSGTDPDLPPYCYDPAKAQSLLKAAGYESGLTLSIDRPVISPDESQELVSMLREQWAKVGITLVERVEENREQYALSVRAKQITDMCIFDSSPMSTFRILREKLNSRFAGPWWEGYENQVVNEMMEQAWGTVDDQKRTALYRQAYRLIHEDAPWLFLYNPMDMWVVDSKIKEALPNWRGGVDGLVLFGERR